MKQKDTGILLQEKNIKLHRIYFERMVKLIGIQVIYRAPLESKQWDGRGELDAYYQPPVTIGCIFEDHVDQKTAKKRGWISELQEGSSMIHVPYDLKDIQIGALFIIPSGLDNAKGRVFKVIGMQNIAVYPSSITCEIAPVYTSSFDRETLSDDNKNLVLLADTDTDNEGSNFIFLNEEEDTVIDG